MLAQFALAGAATGGLVGFGAGVAWLVAGLPAVGLATAAAVVGGAAALDLAARRWSRLGPPAARSQVPQAWGRILGPGTTATLYGARLGVGPLTMLPTWLWWAAAGVGASLGPWAAATTGAAFALTRAASTVAASLGVDAGDGAAMARRTARLHAATGRVALGVPLVAVTLLAAALLVAGPLGPGRATGAGADAVPSVPDGLADGGDRQPGALDGDRPPFDVAARPPSPTGRRAAHPTPHLSPEDAVAVAALTDLLPTESLDGFGPADAELGAGPLDLEAAARAELDVEAERALLLTRHFQRGVSRAWRHADGSVAHVTLYEFAEPAGAALYLLDGVQTLEGRTATRFPVPEIEGALGVTQVDETGAGAFTAHAVAFAHGTRYALVIVGGTSSLRTPDEARALASAVAEHLGAPVDTSGRETQKSGQ